MGIEWGVCVVVWCGQYYLINDQKLKKFVPLIKDSIVYPVIYDANRTVLSLPPIINGAHSAVRNRFYGRTASALAVDQSSLACAPRLSIFWSHASGSL
jgi:hypothetical protein